ncbi:MAG TPA: DUF3048 domain-containing protein [Candidatus Deferrimicrobiaceae bacterium]|nr:DUF3048 domain-containing protein [Candidatus Deferrimicrobiaceae bacterium]
MDDIAPPPASPNGTSRSPLVIGGLAVVAVIAAIALLAGLGFPASGGPVASASTSPGPSPSPTPTELPITPAPATPKPTPPPTPTPEPTPALVPAPLTGLPVSPEAAMQHPIAVMVDDHPDARPQAGFNAASVVWQAPAEGGVPRYMLIFQDQIPTDVGPIRSARQYYIEWAAELNAMYVHHGGSPQAKVTLLQKGSGQWVWNADGFRWEGSFLFRVNDRFAPHNVMTDGDLLRRLARRIGAEDGAIEPAWSFAPDAVPSRRPTDGRIVIHYGVPDYETVSYRYDAATNTYRRFVGQAGGRQRPQFDAADGLQVAPKNVVILRMAFGPLTNDKNPAKDRQEASNVGKGRAWIATNGRTIRGTWRKASPTAPTLLFDRDGNPVTLTAGQTFVQVIPLTYEFKIDDGELPIVVPNGVEDPG